MCKAIASKGDNMPNRTKPALYINYVYSSRESIRLKICHTNKTKCQNSATGMYFDSLIADNRKKIVFRNNK